MAKTVEQTLVTLKELQSVDDRLGEVRAAVAALSLRVDEHKQRVAELEADLQKRAAELKVQEKDSAIKELELKTIQDKIAKLKTQLTEIRSNKQYAAVVHEIGGHEAAGSRTEDEELVIMGRVEDVRSVIEQLRRQIVEAKEAVRTEEAAVAGEVGALSGEMRQLSAQRQALLQQLDKIVVDKYDRIMRIKEKNGKAVVPVKDGTCQGCFMGITRQTIARLWAKKELLHCPNCARLLYLEGGVQ